MSQLYIKFLYQHVKKLHDDRKYIISNYQKLHEEYLDQRNIIIFQDEKEKLEDEILLLEKDIKTCTEEIREVETQIQQHENSRKCQRKTKNFVNSVLKVRTRIPFFYI